MSYQLALTERAEQDFFVLLDWYESQQMGLGERLIADIEQGFEKLRLMPLSYAIVHKTARRLTLKIFPVSIFYRVVENHVQVFAIYHGARNPPAWQNRLSEN